MVNVRDTYDTGKTRISGTEEALAEIFLELLNPKEENLLTVSDITPEEVFGMSLISTYANLFGSTMLKDWKSNFLRGRISRLRLGRKELVLLGTGINDLLKMKKSGKMKLGDLFQGM